MSIKDELLKLFEDHIGSYISGEDIAARLGVSRTAVWNAVKKLQNDGYDIDAVTNRGYKLADGTDILSKDGICSMLNDRLKSTLDIEVFTVVDSTNNVCKARAAGGEFSTYVAISAAQDSGRGRRGRSFYSPAGSGVYISILLKPKFERNDLTISLTTMTAVAVCMAIERLTNKKPSIKWVNDVFVDGLKVSGILCEATYDIEDARLGSVIIGVGINVFEPKGGFPKELHGIAGSVLDDPGSSSRNAFAAEFLNAFFELYDEDSPMSYVDEYRKRSFVIGKDIEVVTPSSISKATAISIGDDCSLRVRYEDGGEEDLHSGEISIKVDSKSMAE